MITAQSYDGEREHAPSGLKENDRITTGKFTKLMGKGYTFQFHHPQHVESVHSIQIPMRFKV